jgi:DNA invertase Pin-like site-specific DNA recombinase
MSTDSIRHSKVTAAHLNKHAYVYIRQSTVKQVVENQASQENQRRMVERALALGWPASRIHVIDEDQGLSGRGSDYRHGYQRLVTEVSLAQVGIIIGYEVSRLARNNRDWYHLLDLATVFGTLIADHDGVYNPRMFNDRLLLGLKGTMSEVELHLLQQRLEAGRLRKVEQGTYRQILPTGLVRSTDGRVELEPDAEVRHCIELVLTKFAELGSCGQVLRTLRDNRIRLPRRQARGPEKGQIVWKEATHSAVYEIVRNPAYAGAFVYGRKQTDPIHRQPGRPFAGRRRKAQSDWLQIRHDAYPAYISWEQYQANQARLRENGLQAWKRSATRQGAAREGYALLQGMAICGRCGHHCQVNYRERRNHRYQCHAVYRKSGRSNCPTIHGPSVDGVVVEAFFAALRPANLDALEGVLAAQAEEQARLERQWDEQLERVRYEAQRARRQYMQVEPENRLVAAELERRWEERLEELQAAEDKVGRLRESTATPKTLTTEMRGQFAQISERLPELWDQFTPVQQKTLLRSLVDHAVLTRQAPDQVEVKVVWVSGYYTSRVVQVPTSRREDVTGYDQMVHRIGELYRQGLDDRQIAQQLSQEGFHSAHRTGVAVNAVKTIRQEAGWHHPTGPRPALKVGGWLTTAGMAARLEVERRWVHWRLKNGVIADHYVTRDPETGNYLIADDPELIEQLRAMIGKRIRFKC